MEHPIGVRARPVKAPPSQRGGEESPGLGAPLILLLLYLVMEYGRPANPMKIPMLISIALFIFWVTAPNKRYPPQLVCFILLLGVIAVMGPFALNSFSIFWGFVGMAVQLLCICAPLMHFVNTMRKLRIFLGAWIAVFSYLALFGLFQEGVGPGGHVGDENDLALALNVVIPFAFAAMVGATRSGLARLAGATIFVLMIVAVGATFSRGGFLGLVAVLLYCFFFLTKRKVLSLVLVGLAVLALRAAPASYLDRVNSIVDEMRGVEGEGVTGTGELRQEYWKIARGMFYANPVFGVGLDNYRWTISYYQPTEDVMDRIGRSFAGSAAHSLYFTMLAELGSAGSILFVLLIWYTVRDTGRILRTARRRDGPLDRHRATTDPGLREDLKAARLYAHAIRAALLGYLVSGTFLSVFTYPHFWLLVALTVALQDATRKRLGLPAESELGRPVPAAVHATTPPPTTLPRPGRRRGL